MDMHSFGESALYGYYISTLVRYIRCLITYSVDVWIFPTKVLHIGHPWPKKRLAYWSSKFDFLFDGINGWDFWLWKRRMKQQQVLILDLWSVYWITVRKDVYFCRICLIELYILLGDRGGTCINGRFSRIIEENSIYFMDYYYIRVYSYNLKDEQVRGCDYMNVNICGRSIKWVIPKAWWAIYLFIL